MKAGWRAGGRKGKKQNRIRVSSLEHFGKKSAKEADRKQAGRVSDVKAGKWEVQEGRQEAWQEGRQAGRQAKGSWKDRQEGRQAGRQAGWQDGRKAGWQRN
jgi:hypothetical protein